MCVCNVHIHIHIYIYIHRCVYIYIYICIYIYIYTHVQRYTVVEVLDVAATLTLSYVASLCPSTLYVRGQTGYTYMIPTLPSFLPTYLPTYLTCAMYSASLTRRSLVFVCLSHVIADGSVLTLAVREVILAVPLVASGVWQPSSACLAWPGLAWPGLACLPALCVNRSQTQSLAWRTGGWDPHCRQGPLPLKWDAGPAQVYLHATNPPKAGFNHYNYYDY